MDEKLRDKYLPNKKVIVKLIVREGAMIKDPKHIGYGGFDGAITGLQVYYDRNLRKLVDPFNGNEEERKFFEDIFKKQLHVYGDNEFWDEYVVKIIKDSQLVSVGLTYDMSNPNDNLAIKVLKTNHTLVCEGWENRHNLPTYKYCILEENYDTIQKSNEFDETMRIGEFFGQMKENSIKMRDFLNIYFSNNKKNKFVSDNMSKEDLKAQIQNIIKSDKNGYVELIDDERYDEKVFVAKCIDKNLINRRGATSYIIVGMENEISYIELLDKIKELKEITDPLYMKMLAKLEIKKQK